MDAKGAKRSVNIWTTNFYKNFPKIFCCTWAVVCRKFVQYIRMLCSGRFILVESVCSIKWILTKNRKTHMHIKLLSRDPKNHSLSILFPHREFLCHLKRSQHHLLTASWKQRINREPFFNSSFWPEHNLLKECIQKTSSLRPTQIQTIRYE